MVSWLFRVLRRHPKACLVPVVGLGALAGAQLLVHLYAGERFLVEPFGYLVALSLVLATLTLLMVALAEWIRARIDTKLTAMEDHLASHLAEILSRLVQDGVYRRRRLSVAWNADTQSSGAVYGQRTAVGAHKPRDVMEQIMHWGDPEDTGSLPVP
jgi:hypothetical protein